MPQSLLTGAHAVSNQTAIARQGPPTFPSGCAGTSCSKSAPVAPTPVLTIAGLVALAGTVLKTSGAGWSRRIRTLTQRLPRGTVSVVFRPPQFSTPANLAA
jgi:hypothetical protein